MDLMSSKTFISKMIDRLLHLSYQLHMSLLGRQTVRVFKTIRQLSQRFPFSLVHVCLGEVDGNSEN